MADFEPENIASSNGLRLRIKGKVQGVGFRPYVWLLARRFNLCGEVSNDGAGVIVQLWQSPAITDFLRVLPQECPPLARIDSVTSTPFNWPQQPASFTIASSGAGQVDTHIVADAATCDACLAELNMPHNRRYHYPFINCTHCGPRFTIIRRMPYDRPNTSMQPFPLCPQCLAEYQDPADRRFHAQPTACPECGPHLWLSDATGQTTASADDALQLAAQALIAGQIVAVKGIGGFHLACDATNPAAVQRLRARKHRPAKPLAVMMPDTYWLQQCVQVAEPTALLKLLRSPPAPIVLVAAHPQSPLCGEIAPGLNEIGVMLPANPLQHLLLQQVARPLVMTSGNPAGKPPALSNQQALEELAGVADVWLLHNREIVQRADDSLVRLTEQGSEMLRRARGYVPDAMPLPPGFTAQPAILALGADSKNTFCLLWGNQAVVSQHLGSLGDEATRQQQQQLLALFGEIYGVVPQAIAIDAHPGYLSHQQGQALATELAIPCITTLHHHAHLVACLAEHGWPRDGGKVIGLALDGLGYGLGGQLWGGECLLVDYQHCEHLGGLPAVALPGGDVAARQPWRNLLAQLQRFVPDWQTLPEAAAIPQLQATILLRAVERQINSPLASSAGRLFDAVAAALQIVPQQLSWEGEAACQLEALAWQSPPHQPPVSLPLLDNQLDLATFWRQWLAYQAPPAQRAYAFHVALAQGFAALARRAIQQYGINTVVLSGGVMHNALLRQLLLQQLDGTQVLLPSRLPAGDGGLALGQALIAANRLISGKHKDEFIT
ncbi:carbamoyltransferase HypF [Serratia fonticola]|uniref:carbamoyltransferase HypF n=1 Tax=Serratia fonticola TaxID=47917 RepID=UPI0027F7ACA7|nr:carbamoyltransferase HypF [Serratia fonticola]MDQ7207239.1 carbamoyltransferase HypF [Serratia fonticola]HBE9077475.1 carbamoyltransferase HypF [Serratia fonticola]HBE9088045.1 carbamoyltransferase HypF [Serratia fonticola]HBE9153870.1 carbamoyltransferase HypF [Serratia fonticola]